MAFRSLLLHVAIAQICLRLITCQDCDEFQVQPKDLVVAAGSMAFMECDYGSEARDLFWEKDGTSIATGVDRPCDCQVTSNGTLEFNNISADETGEYTCNARLSFTDRRRCSANLKLAEAPIFSGKRGPGSVNSNNRELSVDVTGDPLPTVQWRFNNNQPITESETFSFMTETLEDGAKERHTLIITDIMLHHRGRYTLHANNTAGSDNIHWDVRVPFGNVTMTKSISSSTIRLTCTGQFYTNGSRDIQWERGGTIVPQTGQSVETPRTYETLFETHLNIQQSTCSGSERVDCILTYEGVGGQIFKKTASDIVCDDVCNLPELRPVGVGCSNLTLELEGNHGSYVVEYRAEGSFSWIESEQQIQSSPQTFVISDLMEDTRYDIRVGCGSSSMTTEPFSYTTISKPPPVTGLYIDIIYNNSGTFSVLNWQPAVGVGATSYKIMWSSGGDQAQIVSVDMPATSYEWAIMCDVTYVYQVMAVNPCGDGNPSAPVQRTCLDEPPPQRVEIAQPQLTTFDSELALLMHFSVDTQFQDFFKSARVDILEQNNNFVTFQILNYTIDESTYKSGSVCVTGLTPDAQYLVCLNVEFTDIGHTFTCVRLVVEAKEEDEGEEEETQETCQLPAYIKFVGEPEKSADASTIPDWGIAVTVVAALLAVALLFCFLGLCFACQTSQSKNVSFGSMSSINTDRGGNVVPTNMHMHNPRSMSPTRSCLKYHRDRGHSTMWSIPNEQHIDTLRQMETDKGTHV